jgi:hypothetical protein
MPRRADPADDRRPEPLMTYRVVKADPELRAIYEAGFLASIERANRLSDDQRALLRAINRSRRVRAAA